MIEASMACLMSSAAPPARPALGACVADNSRNLGRKFRFRRNPFLIKGESITSEAAILGSARAGAAPCWRRRRRRRRAPPLRRRRRTVATARASTRGEEDDAHLLPPSADSVRQHADDQLSVSDLVKKRTHQAVSYFAVPPRAHSSTGSRSPAPPLPVGHKNTSLSPSHLALSRTGTTQQRKEKRLPDRNPSASPMQSMKARNVSRQCVERR